MERFVSIDVKNKLKKYWTYLNNSIPLLLLCAAYTVSATDRPIKQRVGTIADLTAGFYALLSMNKPEPGLIGKLG